MSKALRTVTALCVALFSLGSAPRVAAQPVAITAAVFQWGDVLDRAVPGDYDGDGRTDLAVYRPSNGVWFVNSSTAGAIAIQWGNAADDVAVPGDYDGDGRTDLAVYRPSGGTWHIVHSSTGAGTTIAWGNAADDIAVPADYDGDGKTNVAVFRPSTGTWVILNSATGTAAILQWGTQGDLPVPGDYNGDGQIDVAVFRPSTGIWYVQGTDGAGVGIPWGSTDDIPVQGDYDGDGATDIAVFRPSDSTWYVRSIIPGTAATVPWGVAADIPVPGDYNGDAITDIAVFRPSNATWYLLLSGSNGPRLLMIDGAHVARVRDSLRRGEPQFQNALRALEADANNSLRVAPLSVMDKPATPPSGDKHDYMSQAPYWWPDPSEPGGRPYILRDGERNPEIDRITDRAKLGRLSSTVSTLGLAFYFTGREEYAQHAARLVRVWFLDPATEMNPHLRFGQRIPGVVAGRSAGIIETRLLPEIIDGVLLLQGSSQWTVTDENALKDWMREYLEWLLESPFGRAQSGRGNNQETWYRRSGGRARSLYRTDAGSTEDPRVSTG